MNLNVPQVFEQSVECCVVMFRFPCLYNTWALNFVMKVLYTPVRQDQSASRKCSVARTYITRIIEDSLPHAFASRTLKTSTRCAHMNDLTNFLKWNSTKCELHIARSQQRSPGSKRDLTPQQDQIPPTPWSTRWYQGPSCQGWPPYMFYIRQVFPYFQERKCIPCARPGTHTSALRCRSSLFHLFWILSAQRLLSLAGNEIHAGKRDYMTLWNRYNISMLITCQIIFSIIMELHYCFDLRSGHIDVSCLSSTI